MTDLSRFAAFARANIEALALTERELAYQRVVNIVAAEIVRVKATRSDGGANSTTVLVLESVATLLKVKHGEIIAPPT